MALVAPQFHHSVQRVLEKRHASGSAADGSTFTCCSMLLERYFPMLVGPNNPEGLTTKWHHVIELTSTGPELSAWISSHSLKRMFKVDGIAVCPCCKTSESVRISDLGNPNCVICDSIFLEGDLCLT